MGCGKSDAGLDRCRPRGTGILPSVLRHQCPQCTTASSKLCPSEKLAGVDVVSHSVCHSSQFSEHGRESQICKLCVLRVCTCAPRRILKTPRMPSKTSELAVYQCIQPMIAALPRHDRVCNALQQSNA